MAQTNSLTALKNASAAMSQTGSLGIEAARAAGSSSMDGATPVSAAAAVRTQNNGSERGLLTASLSPAENMGSTSAPPINHDYRSRQIRNEAINDMMSAKRDIFESWGTALKSLVALPYAMMRSGIEKGFAVGGEGVLGYAAAAGLGLVGGIAGIPMGIAGFVGQFISGFFVR